MIGRVNTGGGGSAPDLEGAILSITSDFGATIIAKKGNKKFTATLTSRIPNEYQEVEYIKSDGNCYIDTGIVPIMGKMELDAVYHDTSGNNNSRCVVGVSDSGKCDVEMYFYNNIPYGAFGLGISSGTATYIGNTSVSNGTRFQATISNINGTVTLTNSKTSNTATKTNQGTATNTTRTIHLFGRNNGGSAVPCNASVYSFKIYDVDNKLICDYVPCYRKSDNVIGMYDLVTGKFIQKSGTGNFTKGEDATPTQGTVNFTVKYSGTWTITASKDGEETISKTVDIQDDGITYVVKLFWNVPSEYQAVEYLQTTTTTYIELDIKTNEINKFYAKCQQIDTADSFTVVMAIASQWYYPLMMIQTSEIGGIFGSTWSRASGQVTSAINEVIVDCPVGGKYGLTINGVKQGVSGTVTNCAVNLMVFGGNKTNWNRVGRLYKIEFYNDDTLVADLYPCYRKSDNVAGLWDNVNEKFYTNVGTGSFVVGGDI